MLERPRVMVLQRLLPAYRVPFFEALSSSEKAEFTLVFGDAPPGSALQYGGDISRIRHEKVVNRFIGVGGREMICWQQGLTAMLAKRRPDVVIAEFNPRIFSTMRAFFARRKLGMNWVWWGHGFGPRAGWLGRMIRMRFARAADAMILYGNAQAERFESMGMESSRLFIAPNSIETGEIDRLAAPWNEGARRYDVLYIGRLIPEKKVSLLLRGFAAAQGRLAPETRLVIIGDGPLRAELGREADALGIAGRTVFAGALYEQEKLAPWFNASWVSVSPGGVGLSAVHSLAYGVPMAVADGEPHGPEADALLDGENTVFFAPNDPQALAGMLGGLWSSGAARRMGLAGQTYVRKNLGVGNMVESFERAALQAWNRERCG